MVPLVGCVPEDVLPSSAPVFSPDDVRLLCDPEQPLYCEVSPGSADRSCSNGCYYQAVQGLWTCPLDQCRAGVGPDEQFVCRFWDAHFYSDGGMTSAPEVPDECMTLGDFVMCFNDQCTWDGVRWQCDPTRCVQDPAVPGRFDCPRGCLHDVNGAWQSPTSCGKPTRGMT